MINRIERYFLLILLRRFIFVFLIMTGFIWISILSGQFAKNISHPQISLLENIAISILRLPNLVNVIFPAIFLATLLASMITLLRSNELIIMRASGLSPARLAIVIMMFALFLSACKIFLLDTSSAIIERSYSSYKHHLVLSDFFKINYLNHTQHLRIPLENQHYILIIIKGFEKLEKRLISPIFFEIDDESTIIRHIKAENAVEQEQGMLLSKVTIFKPGHPVERVDSYAIPFKIDFLQIEREAQRLSRTTPKELWRLATWDNSRQQRLIKLQLYKIWAQPIFFSGIALITLGLFLPCHNRTSGFSQAFTKTIFYFIALIALGHFVQSNALHINTPLWLVTFTPSLLALFLGSFLLLREK